MPLPSGVILAHVHGVFEISPGSRKKLHMSLTVVCDFYSPSNDCREEFLTSEVFLHFHAYPFCSFSERLSANNAINGKSQFILDDGLDTASRVTQVGSNFVQADAIALLVALLDDFANARCANGPRTAVGGVSAVCAASRFSLVPMLMLSLLEISADEGPSFTRYALVA